MVVFNPFRILLHHQIQKKNDILHTYFFCSYLHKYIPEELRLRRYRQTMDWPQIDGVPFPPWWCRSHIVEPSVYRQIQGIYGVQTLVRKWIAHQHRSVEVLSFSEDLIYRLIYLPRRWITAHLRYLCPFEVNFRTVSLPSKRKDLFELWKEFSSESRYLCRRKFFFNENDQKNFLLSVQVISFHKKIQYVINGFNEI